MDGQEALEFQSARSLIESLFEKDLRDPVKFDPEVVSLVQAHLGLTAIHTQAGARLATALVELAKRRAEGGQP